MSLASERLLAEVLMLPPSQREALAEDALSSLTDSDRQSIDDAWLAEARRRYAEYLSAATPTKPVDEVFRGIDGKARP